MKKKIKILLISILLIFIFVRLLILVFNNTYVQNVIEKAIIVFLERKLDADVGYSSLEISLLPSYLKLQKINIEFKNNMDIQAGELVIYPRLFSGWGKIPKLERLYIKEVNFIADLDSLSKGKDADDESSASSWKDGFSDALAQFDSDLIDELVIEQGNWLIKKVHLP